MRNNKRRFQPSKGAEVNSRIQRLNSIKNLMTKNIRAARKEIIQYVEDNPNDMFGRFVYGHIEEQLGDFESAKHQFTIVANSECNNKYSATVRLGDIARKQGQTNTARKLYNEAISKSPKEESYAIYALAKLERIEKNYDVALSVLRKLANPDDTTKLETVKILSLQGKTAQAAALLKTISVTNEKQKRELSLEKGKVCRQQGDIAGAQFHYLGIIGKGIKDNVYYQALHENSKVELESGDPQAVVNYCLELINAGETFEKEAYVTLGLAQQALGNYDQAIKSYKEATESRDFDTRSSAYYYLGSLQFAKGDFEAAIQSLLNSLASDRIPPNSTNVKLVSMYLRLGKYDVAEQYIAQLREKSPKVVEEVGLTPACIILDKIAGRPLPPREKCNYADRQTIEYRSDDALDHIKSHHASGNRTKSNFSSQIDVTELFDSIKLQMVPENRVNGDIMDLYEIDYPNAGYDQEDNLVHRVRVVALPGTTDIITMYPSSKDGIRQSDIVKQTEMEGNKVNSRVNKFNARFAKFTAQSQ